MSELCFWNKSDFELKIASLGPLLVWLLVEIWSDKSQILKFLGLIFCLAALLSLRDLPQKCSFNLVFVRKGGGWMGGSDAIQKFWDTFCVPNNWQSDQIIDRATREGLTRILGAPVGERAWQQAQLPVAMGGMGLRGAKDNAPAAYAASVLAAQPLSRDLLGTAWGFQCTTDLVPALPATATVMP